MSYIMTIIITLYKISNLGNCFVRIFILGLEANENNAIDLCNKYHCTFIVVIIYTCIVLLSTDSSSKVASQHRTSPVTAP